MKSPGTGLKMLRLAISDIAVLKACYMPFLQRKGLFVPSRTSRELGERLFLILRLEQQNLTLCGMTSVCWITPEYSSDGREAGYGLHFDERSEDGGAEDNDSETLGTAIEAALSAHKDALQQVVSYTL